MPHARTVVLIPYYNARASLVRSLASIGPDEQCDVLVVDDGSTDEPLDHDAALGAFHASGSLHTLRLPENRGIETALNTGLDWIAERDYEYVARLDCGDENVPDRLDRQVRHLDSHPGVLLLGGAAEFVDTSGATQFTLRLPTSHEAIARYMRRNSAFMHPAVMFRASALPRVGRYPVDTPAAEDYAFFWKFLAVGEVANLPEVLIRYELDPGGISLSRRRIQLTSRLAIQRQHDDGSWAARSGIARTVLLRSLPYGLVHHAKRLLRGTDHPAEPRVTDVGAVPTRAGTWRVGLAIEGAVPTPGEQVAIEFAARGSTVDIVAIPRGTSAPPGLDAIVAPAGDAPTASGCPTWSVTDVTGAPLSGALTVVRSVRVADPVMVVQVRSEAGEVLSSGTVTSRRSVAATRAQMLRVLGPLLVIATRSLQDPTGRTSGGTPDLAEPAPPRPGTVALADAVATIRFAGRVARRSTSLVQWGIAKVPGPDALATLMQGPGVSSTALRWHHAPAPNFWADPCVVGEDPSWLFVEELNRATGRGAIRGLRVEGDRLSPGEVVLATEHHLSYPQTYHVGGRWLATVETCAAHNPIYTFDVLGQAWIPDEQLPALPPHLADPVLLFDGAGRVSGVIGTDARVDPDSVLVTYDLEPASGWTRVDALVRVSVVNGRGGGTLDATRGLRATQDCAGTYGRALEVIRWPSSDRPQTLLRMDGSTVSDGEVRAGLGGVHTLTWSADGQHVWLDGWRRRPTPMGWRLDLAERQHLKSCTG